MVKALLMGAAEKPPWYGLMGERGLEPAVHFVADMFTVPQAILHKWNLISQTQAPPVRNPQASVIEIGQGRRYDASKAAIEIAAIAMTSTLRNCFLAISGSKASAA